MDSSITQISYRNNFDYCYNNNNNNHINNNNNNNSNGNKFVTRSSDLGLAVDVKNVSFGYKNKVLILNNISVEIPKGKLNCHFY